ncbi:MAG: nucleotidyl transferase AbiEii/AbiGii toxin family protein [Verrucomicrobiales bacterium]|nr:nucleotidyl transferase AbiEii/AbiGii toxin family protein [Verrucomicrobiales bacterium]
MTRLVNLAAEIQSILDSNSWKNCLIGGLALQRWGAPRLTIDVDITVLTGFGKEEALVDLLLCRYTPRRPDAREFALQNRVLLIQSTDGIGIDIALGALPFERRMIRRATTFAFLPDCLLRTCSAEDLVVTKAFAGREQDWIDLKGIIVRQQKLNWKLIYSELKPLCKLKDTPETLDRLRKLQMEFAGQ